MAYMIGFYVLIFSLIPHKEMRFMLAITAFMFLTLGFLLNRVVTFQVAKRWGKWINLLIWITILYEFYLQGRSYYLCQQWQIAKFMMNQNTHPRSVYIEINI